MEDANEILRLVTNDLNRSEKAKVIQSIKRDEGKKEIYKKAKFSWALVSTGKPMPEEQTNEAFRMLRRVISRTNKQFNFRPLLKYAVMVLAIVSVSISMYILGHNTAGTGSAQIITVIAENGQISKIVLPDSSTVWLNSGSSIRYNNQYGIDNRNMTLSGQAYFDVSKNKQLPFIVSCRDIDVKALGTKFDVSSYPDETETSVVLETGRVELSKVESKQLICRLSPGERAVFDATGQSAMITATDASEYTNWKSGLLIFHDAPMDEVIRKLSRKYDIEVEVKNPRVLKSVFTARFKNESLDNIAELMEFTCKINAEVIREDGICTKLILE